MSGPAGAAAAALAGLPPRERHRRLVAALAAAPAPPPRTDADALRAGHRFLRTAADDAPLLAGGGPAAGAAAASEAAWEARLARRYYDRLFREYALADLSRAAEGLLGLRWRTRAEVVSGAGQFACGALGCGEARGLESLELPFAYDEAGERRRALVKVRCCPRHASQLAALPRAGARRAGGGAAKDKKDRRKRHRRDSSSGSPSGSDSGSGGSPRRRRRARGTAGCGDDPLFAGLFD